jgi:hypothetical protein
MGVISIIMRAQKNNPRMVYDNFWDWLRSDLNYFWTVGLMFGYMYYLVTTYEV